MHLKRRFFCAYFWSSNGKTDSLGLEVKKRWVRKTLRRILAMDGDNRLISCLEIYFHFILNFQQWKVIFKVTDGNYIFCFLILLYLLEFLFYSRMYTPLYKTEGPKIKGYIKKKTQLLGLSPIENLLCGPKLGRRPHNGSQLQGMSFFFLFIRINLLFLWQKCTEFQIFHQYLLFFKIIYSFI